jgi:transcription antitermination factor NusG
MKEKLYLCNGNSVESSIGSVLPLCCYENMEEVVKTSDSQYDKSAVSGERNAAVPLGSENSGTGKSVEYALQDAARHWFPIRATYHRAQKVYNRLLEINDGRLEPYLPMLRSIACGDESLGSTAQQVREEPLDKGLLFVRCTLGSFSELVKNQIPGLTPYYNHFSTNKFGRNEYLIVPDRQMESFRIIVESRNNDILVRQTEVPQFIEGDSVVVTDGPFAGVEGVVMKYKHQKRVFVQLHGIGIYATAYVPSAWLKKIDN